jgi:hypothetical protein
MLSEEDMTVIGLAVILMPKKERQIIESSFGVLASRFRVFYTALGVSIDNTEYVVKGACALHRFICKTVPAPTVTTLSAMMIR